MMLDVKHDIGYYLETGQYLKTSNSIYSHNYSLSFYLLQI